MATKVGQLYIIVQDMLTIGHNDIKYIWSFDNMYDYFLLVRHYISGRSLLSFRKPLGVAATYVIAYFNQTEKNI